MKVLIADNHALHRIGMRELLRELDPEVAVVEVGTFDSALNAVKQEPAFDLLVLDIDMPGMAGVDGVAALHRRAPDTPLLVVTDTERPEAVRASFERGAVGFMDKSMNPLVMLNAVRLVLSGGTYVPSSVLFGRQARGSVNSSLRPYASWSRSSTLGLTRRQHDVLRLLARGMRNKDIARELDLAEGTVKVHVSAIIKALKVSNRTEAVVKAGEAQMTEGET